MRPIRHATLLLALVLVSAAPVRGESRFAVTSRSLATVTVDGGRSDGLSVGDRLRVVQGGTTIAEVEIVSAAERWSSCRVVSSTGPVGRGDLVVLATRPPPAPARRRRRARPRRHRRPHCRRRLPTVPPYRPLAEARRPDNRAERPASFGSGGRPEVQRQVPLHGQRLPRWGTCRGHRRRGPPAGRLGKDAVGELEVVYAAEMSASCRILSETRPVRAGDVAVLLSAPRATAASSVAPAPSTSAAAAPPRPRPPLRVPGQPCPGPASAAPRRSATTGLGRDGVALDFEERTARLDLGLYDIGGQPLSFTLRGRSREDVRARTLSQRTPASERTDRLYEVALRYEPPSDKVGLEVGRIGIYRFVGIGYLDGVLGASGCSPRAGRRIRRPGGRHRGPRLRRHRPEVRRLRAPRPRRALRDGRLRRRCSPSSARTPTAT